MITLSYNDIDNLGWKAAQKIRLDCKSTATKFFGIPRGGVPAVYAMLRHTAGMLVDTPEEADVIVDDLIDSGETAKRYAEKYNKPVVVLIDKREPDSVFYKQWITFPWEQGENEGDGIEDNIRRIIEYMGEDPNREGLIETPRRVAKAWKHWCCGYDQDAASVLKVFEDGAQNVDELVLVQDISFTSFCEHHMAPFLGTADIGYIPSGRIVGLSKLSRLLDVFARRLQVQERLTVQVADALEKHLQPLAVGVVLRAEHTCMTTRGIAKHGHTTVTSALRGAFRDDARARLEFMTLIKK